MTMLSKEMAPKAERAGTAASLARSDIIAALGEIARLRSDMSTDYSALWHLRLRLDVVDEIELRIKAAGRWLLLLEEGK